MNVYEAFSPDERLEIMMKKEIIQKLVNLSPFSHSSHANFIMAGDTVHKVFNGEDAGYGPVDFYVPGDAKDAHHFIGSLSKLISCGKTPDVWRPNRNTWPAQWVDEDLIDRHIVKTYSWPVNIERSNHIRYNLHITNFSKVEDMCNMQTIYHTAHCYYRHDSEHKHLFINRPAYDLIKQKQIKFNLQTESAKKMIPILDNWKHIP
jgi:hypothetical protein